MYVLINVLDTIKIINAYKNMCQKHVTIKVPIVRRGPDDLLPKLETGPE